MQIGVVRVHMESILPCSAEKAWAEVRKVSLLTEVAHPLVTFAPEAGESLPERWAEGSVVRIRSYLCGLIPLGTRELTVETLSDERREVQTREHDPLVRRWDHRISVGPRGGDTCLYVDEVYIEAGVLTPGVWLFAQCFFRHRHRRWQRVAERLRMAPADGAHG